MGELRRRSGLRRVAGRVLLAVVAVVWSAGTGSGSRAAGNDPVLTAVGDITSCSSNSDDATAALAAEVPGPIAALGDLVEGKAANEFRDCFDPSWGFLRERIRPIPGDNGEYGRGVGPGRENAVPQLDDYHAYFGAAAGSPDQRWYSYDVGSWHVIALDSNCADEEGGCREGSAMEEWLEDDLAAHPSQCVAVVSHHNFIEEPGRTFKSMKALLRPMYEYGVDLWVTGHRHTYRRYAPVDIRGERDEEFGIRQIIVGTGGHPRTAGKVVQGGALEVSHGDSWGVLRLTLKPGGYDWRFVPAVMQKSSDFTDSGSDTCHWGTAGPRETTTTTAPATTNTTQPAPTTTTTTPSTPPTQSQGGRSGYWMLGGEGEVYAFGDAEHMGNAVNRMVNSEAVDLEPTPSFRGYWIVDRRGRVFALGDANHLGQIDRSFLSDDERVTSLSATPSGQGYWIFTTKGKVIAFGDAGFYGDMSAVALNGPVLDSIPTPSGQGYYMVASDGGIFAFGDADFYGSMGNTPLNAPVQSLVPDSDGAGYWLVASDGGIFAFDAPFRGSMGDRVLNKPITGMVRFGSGYLMVGEDGGIFNFSDRPFMGSLGDRTLSRPIVSVAAVDD